MSGLEGKGHVWCSLVWPCDSVSSFGTLLNLQGPTSLSKLNTFRYLSNTFCQNETLRKMAWDHTSPPWCTSRSLPVGEGSISCMFWSLNQG